MREVERRERGKGEGVGEKVAATHSSSAVLLTALLLSSIAVARVGGPLLLLRGAHLLAPCTHSGSGGPPRRATATGIVVALVFVGRY